VRESRDSLAALRADSRAGVHQLLEFAAIGRTLGVSVPSDADIHARLATADRFDIAALSADSRRLLAAHRAVSEHLHRLPEQQIRLDRGWHGSTANDAIVAVINHQRQAESDLHVLRTLSDATSAAAAGIDRLLRTFLLTIARVAEPTIAGCPVADLPGAVLTGRVPLDLVVADIASRFQLFTTAADAASRGVVQILELLNKATAGLDDESYPEPAGGRPDVVRTRSDITHFEDQTLPSVEISQHDVPVGDVPAGNSVQGSSVQSGGVQGGTVPGSAERVIVDGEPGPGGRHTPADVPLRLGGAATTSSTSRQAQPDATASDGDLALAGDQ